MRAVLLVAPLALAGRDYYEVLVIDVVLLPASKLEGGSC